MPTGVYARPEPIVRFRKKWKLSTEHSYNGEACWEWIGGKNGNGYGHFYVDGKRVFAHRFGYEHFREPIPEDLELDHLCRNRACSHPSHLEAVTHAENVRRGEGGQHNGSKTHCSQGHLFDEANTYWTPRGGRSCRACKRISAGPAGPPNHSKTHCLRGHPFNEENTYTRPGGERLCRACSRERDARRSPPSPKESSSLE